MKSARTVLLISDQALYIYNTSVRGTELIETVPWNAQDFEQNVAAILSKECGNNPTLILNDMIEQHYRKEKVPKVGALDKANVLERKLLVTFPNYPIRAALPLKEKITKDDKKAAGGLYIFAAVPTSDPYSKTLGAARLSTAPIAGFCLLPIESSTLVKKLSDKLFHKEKAKWSVFIGYHQSGGLRQIVTKNGELALTRMTPVSELSDDTASWVSEVNQEFSATMSYLARFGFDTADGLNLIMIAPEHIGESMESILETPCNFKSISPEDAGKMLGLSLKDSHDSHYADELHAAWAGTQNSLLLPMKIKDLESVSRSRQFAMLFSLLLFAGLGIQSYQYFSFFQSLQNNIAEIDSTVQRKSELDIQYQKEVKRKEELGFDIQLIQSSIAVKKEFDKWDIDALYLFHKIGAALKEDMRFDRLELDRNKPKVLTQAPPEGQTLPPQVLYTATLQMSFPSTMDAEKGNKIVEDLKTGIQKSMPESVVKISRLLEDYQYSEGLVVQTGKVETSNVNQDYVAEIKIEKYLE